MPVGLPAPFYLRKGHADAQVYSKAVHLLETYWEAVDEEFA